MIRVFFLVNSLRIKAKLLKLLLQIADVIEIDVEKAIAIGFDMVWTNVDLFGLGCNGLFELTVAGDKLDFLRDDRLQIAFKYAKVCSIVLLLERLE